MRYRFGDYTLDTQRYELCRAGQRVPLRRKVFQVLAYLLTHRDRVVSKEELLAHGWPGQFLSDETLTTCITAARSAPATRPGRRRTGDRAGRTCARNPR